MISKNLAINSNTLEIETNGLVRLVLVNFPVIPLDVLVLFMEWQNAQDFAFDLYQGQVYGLRHLHKGLSDGWL